MKEFKLIVAGSRGFTDAAFLNDSVFYMAEVVLRDDAISIVSGCARGADTFALEFAIANKVKAYKFPAHWASSGKSAGMLRNIKMGKFSDGLLAFWDGKSKGTKHMMDYMRSLGKPVWVSEYNNPDTPRIYEY